MLPADFITMASGLPGLDVQAFLAAMESAPSVSIKLNRRKCDSPDETGYSPLSPVEWCRSGYYLAERPRFTLNPLMHGGVFYVQDASSMIYERIVEVILQERRGGEPPLVLDLCAAPGGKTTSMINALPDGSTVVANEIMPQRAAILRENLIKWGYPDILVTNSKSSGLLCAGEAFDIVAVDAPCSGEGMMRKEPEARAQWSPSLTEQCAALQRSILEDAVAMLRLGGFMIYSTCTFNLDENERNAEWLRDEFGLEPVDTGLAGTGGILPALSGNIPALRFMPHSMRGEGLFAAVFRKPGESVRVNRQRVLDNIRRKSRVILDGIPTTVTKGRDEAPTSEWALSTAFPRGKYPECELDEESALRYLRREAITLPAGCERGYTVVTYKGHPLGFVKNLGNRANNLYPSEWRIRNL